MSVFHTFCPLALSLFTRSFSKFERKVNFIYAFDCWASGRLRAESDYGELSRDFISLLFKGRWIRPILEKLSKTKWRKTKIIKERVGAAPQLNFLGKYWCAWIWCNLVKNVSFSAIRERIIWIYRWIRYSQHATDILVWIWFVIPLAVVLTGSDCDVGRTDKRKLGVVLQW